MNGCLDWYQNKTSTGFEAHHKLAVHSSFIGTTLAPVAARWSKPTVAKRVPRRETISIKLGLWGACIISESFPVSAPGQITTHNLVGIVLYRDG